MLTELVSEYAVKVLDSTHYAGACALMALESMILPIPSEAVMPFVGFQIADGKWDIAGHAKVGATLQFHVRDANVDAEFADAR